MNLKNASTLALIGTLLLTILLALDLFNGLLGVLHDIIPVAAFVRSLIYFFAGLSLTVFFIVFRGSQSR